jgi:hypothetical protein
VTDDHAAALSARGAAALALASMTGRADVARMVSVDVPMYWTRCTSWVL